MYGSNNGSREYYCLLGCNATYFGGNCPMFWRNLLPVSSLPPSTSTTTQSLFTHQTKKFPVHTTDTLFFLAAQLSSLLYLFSLLIPNHELGSNTDTCYHTVWIYQLLRKISFAVAKFMFSLQRETKLSCSGNGKSHTSQINDNVQWKKEKAAKTI